MKFIVFTLIFAIAMSFTPPVAEAQCGKASMYWVGDTECRHGSHCGGQPGRTTASGIPLRDDGFTIAHPRLPFGSHVMVQHGNREVEATVTDRGPFGFFDRIADITLGIAEALGISRRKGVDNVCLSYADGTPVPDNLRWVPHHKVQHVKKIGQVFHNLKIHRQNISHKIRK